jgi:hypothetical protein
VRELPDDIVNSHAPAGAAPASVAHPGPFWCAHQTRFEWDAGMGGYLVDGNAADDELHPKDLPVTGQGALPAVCQPATGFDPAEYPNAGPAAVERARHEVELDLLRRRRHGR